MVIRVNATNIFDEKIHKTKTCSRESRKYLSKITYYNCDNKKYYVNKYLKS